MRVWVLTHDSADGVDLYDFSINPLDIPWVKVELEWLAGAYDDEVEAFKDDVDRMRQSGVGYAEIIERFKVEMADVKSAL